MLVGCSSGGGSGSGGFCTPSVGQWCTYGGQEPVVTNNSFQFGVGGNVIAGYFYTQLPQAPKIGQTLTLNYALTVNNPVWANNPSGGDSGAPTMHLFLWRKGDDLACTATTNHYRQFAARTSLVPGVNQTVSVVLDPSQWVLCGNVAETNTLAYLNDVLNNLLGVGFVFGGQSFAGHGIYLSSGSATFTINSFTVH